MFKKNLLLFTSVVLLGGAGLYLHNKPVVVNQQQQLVVTEPKEEIKIPIERAEKPQKPNITVRIPGYQDYNRIVQQLNEWHQQAPDLTEVGVYGKTSHGKDLYYIRVTNKLSKSPKRVVLTTACIHSNEPIATATVMGYIGTILGTYGEDNKVTELIDTRDIYFVPVVCPDYFPNRREVENGIDPNRDFPDSKRDPNRQSTPMVKALQDLFLKIKPNAVMSGHSFGKIFLYPRGNDYSLCANDADYQRIVGQMSKLSGYGMKRACQLYSRPIFGSEVDFYSQRGAFAVITEFGTHQRIPSMQDTQNEFKQTYSAFLLFCKEGAEVNIK